MEGRNKFNGLRLLYTFKGVSHPSKAMFLVDTTQTSKPLIEQGLVPERRNNSIPGINVPYFRDNFIPGINSVPERRDNATKRINLG